MIIILRKDYDKYHYSTSDDCCCPYCKGLLTEIACDVTNPDWMPWNFYQCAICDELFYNTFREKETLQPL